MSERKPELYLGALELVARANKRPDYWPDPEAAREFAEKFPATFLALLGAARAEGGTATGLASGSLGSGSTAPPEAISPPGGVEELVERLPGLAAERERDDDLSWLIVQQAADALLSQARIVEERIRELEFYKGRERHFASVLGVADGGQYRNDWDVRLQRLCAQSARAETAERLLEEVEEPLHNLIELARPHFRDEVQMLALSQARQALSNIRKEKETRPRDCGTSSAPPFANHAHEVPAAGAVSPGEEGS